MVQSRFPLVLIVLVLLSIFSATSSRAQGYHWERLGTVDGGRITALAASSRGDILAGTAHGGVFRSSNSGASWLPGSNFTSSLSRITSAFALGEAEFFAGTADGVYVSSDQGATWRPVNAGFTSPPEIQSLTFSGSVLFAGFRDGISYLSSDRGWVRVNDGLPTGPNVYALAATKSKLFAGTGKGLFVSTNQGTVWTQVSNGIGTAIVRALALDSATIYAGTDSGVFRSTNDGEDWTLMNFGIAGLPVLSMLVDGTRVFAGTAGGGVFRSTDRGLSWIAVNNGLADLEIRCLARNSSGLFAGTRWGVFYSPDWGEHWSSANSGLAYESVTMLGVVGSALYAGCKDRGLYRSTDSGRTWSGVPVPPPPVEYPLSMAAEGSLIYVVDGGSVVQSTDGGETWRTTGAGLDNSLSCVALNGPDVYVGGNEVWRSTDDGASWTNLTYNYTNSYSGSFYFWVNSLALIDSSIFAGVGFWGQWDGIHVSTDKGQTWGKSLALEGQYVAKLMRRGKTLIAGTTRGLYVVYPMMQFALSKVEGWRVRALACTPSHCFAGFDGGGVFYSIDDGGTWTAANEGLADLSVLALTTDGQTVYAGTTSGMLFRLQIPTSASANVPGLPTTYGLSQNFPNPFNPSTVFRYQLPVAGLVSLVVYDLLGREVKVLLDDHKAAGRHDVRFDATGLPSGMYIARMKAGEFTQSRKVIVLK